MKFKKIMLMTLLLLAILTIGAVSAADDVDALAVNDTGEELAVEAPVDDLAETSSDDVVETALDDVVEASVDDDVVEAEEGSDVLSGPSASFGNEIYSEYHSVVSIFDYSNGLNGTVTLFANGTQVYNKEVAGDSVAIYAKDILGSFYGVYNMKVIYNGTDGINFEKNGTVNFTKSFINKEFVPEDFNVTFPASEIDIGQGNPVVLTYFWPEGVKEHMSSIKVIYGDGQYDYLNFETQWDPQKDQVNVYKNITWEEFYLSEIGVYNLTVFYCEDTKPDLELGKITLNVIENKIYTANDFMEVYTKPITSPTDYVCIVHDENGLNGVVAIYANGTLVFNKTMITTTIAGVKILPGNLTSNLEGNYSIKVVYSRNDGKNYSKEATINFNIPKPLTPEDFNVTIAKNIDIGDGSATVVSWVWPSSVASSDFIKIDVQGGSGLTFQKGTATSGKATLSDLYIWDIGEYNITVTYGYDTFIKNGTIKVTKTYTAADFITIYPYDVTNPEEHIIEVWDGETGKGINGVVEVYANNVKVYTKTYTGTDSGKPIAAKDLTGYFNGQYTIKVVYKRADGKEFTQTETVNFVDIGVPISTSITASSLTVTYNDNKKLVATLKDANGNPISNVDVYISIMGVKYPLKTDKNGQIKQAVGTLTPKKHDVVLTFEATGAYKKSTKTVTVIVKKATPKLTAPKKTFKKSVKTKKYTVTLKSNVNKPLAKVKITLTVKGKKYSGKTNSKGQVTFKITNLKKKATYKATVKSAGNAYYNAKTAKPKIVVK